MSRGKRRLVTSPKALQVYRLRIRGWTSREIAETQGIPERTVRHIIHAGQVLTDGEIRHLNKEGVLRELFENARERTRTLWQLFTTARLEVVKATCIKLLQEEDAILEQLAVRLSLLEPTPDLTTKHDITYTEKKDLRLRVEVRYSDDQLIGRTADIFGRVRRPGPLDCAAPA